MEPVKIEEAGRGGISASKSFAGMCSRAVYNAYFIRYKESGSGDVFEIREKQHNKSLTVLSSKLLPPRKLTEGSWIEFIKFSSLRNSPVDGSNSSSSAPL